MTTMPDPRRDARRESCRESRRQWLRALAAAWLPVAGPAPLRAQGSLPVALRLVLTAPPGSSIDLLGRMVAERLRERLGVPVVPDNRPAAGGTAGTGEVARAAADGATIGLSFTGPLVLAPMLQSRLPYDPERQLAPIVLLGTAPNLLAVNASLPVASFREFIGHVRARPGRLNYSSSGNGSSAHLAMELLKAQAGLFIVHVPYNGAPPAAQAAAAGDVDAIMANPTALLPLIKAGRLRALATTGRGRWAGMSELPTVAESGFAGFEALAWNGFVAPAGTPREWLERLNREINAIVSAPDFKPRAEAAGWDVAGGSIEAFAGFMRAERARWAPVVKRSGAKID